MTDPNRVKGPAYTAPPPARVHVLLARENQKAVVIRRGPSRHTAIYLWNRSDDKITLGQWFKGRIYERRSDLTPDGNHLIYFALNGKFEDPVSLGSWTAISKVPYIKALTFIPWGHGWNGGGLFIDNQRYWLNRSSMSKAVVQRDDKRFIEIPDPEGQPENLSECWHVYFRKLVRDGWKDHGYHLDGSGIGRIATYRFDKPAAFGWRLQKRAISGLSNEKGVGVYRDQHSVLSKNGRAFDNHDWQWAEVDGDSFLFSANGKLFRQQILSESELATPKCIFDFNPERFQDLRAPY